MNTSNPLKIRLFALMYTILPMSSLLQGLNICTGNNKSLSGEIKGVGSAF